MLQYKAGYKFVEGGVHAQVLDFPAAITCGGDLTEARRLLAAALIDVAETLLQMGQPLPQPNPQLSDVDMDIEEPINLHFRASSVDPHEDDPLIDDLLQSDPKFQALVAKSKSSPRKPFALGDGTPKND